MTKSSLIYLNHILECIGNIQDYTHSLNENEFLSNKLVQDAVIRNFEVIGEASKKIPTLIKEKYPGIAWKQMAGMRDKLIHDYIGVDLWAVWGVVKDILPQLKDAIEKMVYTESKNQ